jgi:hypothetical protein
MALFGRFVDRVLGLADGFFRRAGCLVGRAFGAQLVVADSLANGFLDSAEAFLGGVFDAADERPTRPRITRTALRLARRLS